MLLIFGIQLLQIFIFEYFQGCDLLTVSPNLLGEIQQSENDVPQTLDASKSSSDVPKTVLTESEFRWRMCQDECAHFKLAEGIRK